MYNCNPETVSTDFDISDRLYFEPLTFEHVMNVVNFENPDGVLVQFGGQTPLNIANKLEEARVNIIGSNPGNLLKEHIGCFQILMIDMKMEFMI